MVENEVHAVLATACCRIVDIVTQKEILSITRKRLTDGLDFVKQLGIIEYTEQGKQLFPEQAT